MRTKLIVLSTLTCGAALAAALPASGPARAGDRLPAKAASHAAPPAARLADSPLGMAPDRIGAMGAAQFPGVYGSLVITGGGTHIDIYLTSPQRAAEAKLSSLAPRGEVTFLRTSHTRRQLLALHTKITRQARSLAARGIRLVSWFPGVNGDGLEHIGVLNLSAAARATLDREFGAVNIVLSDVPPRDVPAATGRNSDSPPWNGGDNLTSSGIGCTSGAGITYGGHEYMLTAAHCYEPGWSIYNALAGQPGTFMGTESSRDVSYGGDDTALLNMSSSDLIWTGIIGQPVRVNDTGWATNPDGDVVCNEGAYSGEVCSRVQNNYYGCIWVSDYTGLSGSRYECNIVWSERLSSPYIGNQAGDSGGPMIRYVNGSLKVTGIVSAGSGVVPCQYNTTTCYQNDFYTAMDQILTGEYPGASLITG
jgi:hypothetical protein